jgi:hypothetical protein
MYRHPGIDIYLSARGRYLSARGQGQASAPGRRACLLQPELAARAGRVSWPPAIREEKKTA